MMPSFHPPEETLLDYAAGNSPEAVSLVVATHLALCPKCRAQVSDYEAVGGSLIDSVAPVAVGENALSAVLNRLEDAPVVSLPRADVPSADLRVPQPLRDYAGGDLDSSGAQTQLGAARRDLERVADKAGGRLAAILEALARTEAEL